jgi:release factor glutamine methyltransferase
MSGATISSGPAETLDFAAAIRSDAARLALARAFAAAAIESAELDARVLLCAALGIDHAGLIREPERPLGAAAARVAAFAARRLRGEPVSRIVGGKEFWGARLAIAACVLDPRPDTETLVEAALDQIGDARDKNWLILDLGTGSGAILCALLQALPQAFGVGVDLSPAACAVARGNVESLGLARRGAILCGDWTASLRGRFDLIASNPPYIVRADIAGLAPEVRDFDPHLALDGGEDGLAAYRAMSPALAGLLAPGGLIALELGQGQRPAVEQLLRGAGLAGFDVWRDLAGHERVILARAPSLTPEQAHEWTPEQIRRFKTR